MAGSSLIQTFFQESLAAGGIKIGLWVKPTLDIIFSKQKNMVDEIKRDSEFIGLDGLEHGYFTPPPLLTTTPKLIFVGLEPSLGAQNFLKKIDWLSSFDNFILHYAAWESCGNKFDYHFTDVSKFSMRATDAKSARQQIFRKFIPSFLDEINVLRQPSTQTHLICTKSLDSLFRQARILDEIKPLNLALHWSTQIKDEQYLEYFNENQLPIPKFEESEYQEIYKNIIDFSELLMSILGFTDEEKEDRRQKLLIYQQANRYVRHKTCLYFYYRHRFKTLTQSVLNRLN